MSATEQVSKFQRYRHTRRDSGLKLLRVWVPDPRSPAFAQEAHRQAMLLLLRSRIRILLRIDTLCAPAKAKCP